MEKLGSQPEPKANRRPRKQSPLCKHCAASSRRRKKVSRSWLNDRRRGVRESQFGENRLEARFITQRIETPIPEPRRESTVVLDRIDFQLIQGGATFSQRYEIERVQNRVPPEIGIVR